MPTTRFRADRTGRRPLSAPPILAPLKVTSDAPHAVIQPPDLSMSTAAALAGQDSDYCRRLLWTMG